VTGDPGDILAWYTIWDTYSKWCRVTGKNRYIMYPGTMATQAMFRTLGAELSKNHTPLALIRVRQRQEHDEPFHNVLNVEYVQRAEGRDLLGYICDDDMCTRNCAQEGEEHIIPEEATELHVEVVDPAQYMMEASDTALIHLEARWPNEDE